MKDWLGALALPPSREDRLQPSLNTSPDSSRTHPLSPRALPESLETAYHFIMVTGIPALAPGGNPQVDAYGHGVTYSTVPAVHGLRPLGVSSSKHCGGV